MFDLATIKDMFFNTGDVVIGQTTNFTNTGVSDLAWILLVLVIILFLWGRR